MKSLNLKKLLALVLTVAMSLALLAGCASTAGTTAAPAETTAATPAETTAPVDPLGAQPELTVITRGVPLDPNQKYPEGQSLEDNAYTRMLKEKFNIEIQNEFAASNTTTDYSQKVDLAIASGKIPDYLTNLTYTQYRAIVKAGMAMDISQVWDAYASPLTKEVYASNGALFDSLVKKDGAMYGIPASNPLPDFLSVMWIRQDWMDKLSLKAPTNIEELKALAKAFKDQDPDGNGKADTEGLAGPSIDGKLYQDMKNMNFAYHFDQVFAAFNSFPGIWVKDASGKAVYGSTTAETKAALQELASMYQDGLISQGMLTSKTEETLANNKLGLFFGPWWFPFGDLGNSWKNDTTANWQPYLLPSGTDGIYQAKGGNAAQSFVVISKDAKNPEAIIKMLNIFKAGLKNYVSEEDQTTMGDGAYPMYLTFSLAEGPGMVLKEANNYFDGKATADDVHANVANYDAYITQAFDKILVSKVEPFADRNMSAWDFSGEKANDFGWVWSFGVGLTPYVQGNFNWVNSLSYETTKTMEKRWANLTKLEYETFSKIIVGQASIDEFDTFVSQWNEEGGAQIVEEINAMING
ncbi:MAG: extracellular solute-binding protein [Eubacteriales bacterium]|nr:extracellular solute-binding protein [Eubacteriales bacterium]